MAIDSIASKIRMVGIVYLRTNRFEVKLEGISFKVEDFESLYSNGFSFSGEKDLDLSTYCRD